MDWHSGAFFGTGLSDQASAVVVGGTDEGLARARHRYIGLAAHRARIVVRRRAACCRSPPGRTDCRAPGKSWSGSPRCRRMPGSARRIGRTARCRTPRCSCRGRPGPMGWRRGRRTPPSWPAEDVRSLLQVRGPSRPVGRRVRARRRCRERIGRPCSRSLIAVAATRADADAGCPRVGVAVQVPATNLLKVEFIECDGGHEHLDDAGRTVAPVRVARRRMISPVVRSATSRASAETSLGSGSGVHAR